MAAGNSSSLFENCVFAIVPNSEIPESLAVELQQTLEDRKGKVVTFGEPIDLEIVTHIISATSDFPEYSDARLHMIPVVTPTWINHSLLKGKEAPFRPYTPDPDLIFSDVTITCADIPPGDKDAIIGAVLAMGGMESNPLTKAVTHICALTLGHPKCEQALGRKLNCKIVLPHWFDDCLKLGKRIDERPYLLPDPEIFRKNPEDDLPPPNLDTIQGASTPTPDRLSDPKNLPVRRLQVFNNKHVMISEDTGISGRLRKSFEDLIERGGGHITNSVHKADMYVCHWREGRDYILASRAGIDVGNLSWLYYLMIHDRWTSPLRRLLHYPLPREPLKGFKDLKITLSNYGGEARTYLENLVVAAGAEFTKSMKQDNTHLITARNSSEKCDAARDWNVEMVNHLWIEESYARCEIQPLTDPRYSHFPPRTNLGEIIGQTQFSQDTLEDKYFPEDPETSPNDPMPLRRKVMREKDRNTSSSRKEDTTMGGTDDVVNVEPAKTPAPKPARSRASLGRVTTPSVSRRISGGKENDTPSSTNSRSAKDKAADRIHGMATDIALYQKESKRKGSVWGGERAANKLDREKALERSSSPAKHNEEEEFSEEETPNPKRHKSGLPPVTMRLLITGYKGWLHNGAKEEADKKKLREMGILIVPDAHSCTHLAAPAMVRTQKFLCALASGPTILSTDFIEACIEKKTAPSFKDYILQDSENEKKFGLKLKDAVRRAKDNKKSLLRRVPIYCTPDVPNGPATYQSIIEANGGTCAVYRGRPVIKKTSPEEDDGPPEPVYLITGHRNTERELWKKFSDMAKDGNMAPRIVETEWILDVAMTQQNKWNRRYLADKNE